MSNRVYITIQEERELDLDLNPKGEMCKNVYINCDGIKAWLGYIDTKEDLYDLISPENILDSIETSLSEDEVEVIIPALQCSDGIYTLFDKKYKALNV